MPDYSDDIFAQRELYLTNRCLKESDLMRDEDGEYFIDETENGTAGDDGYSIDLKKVYLPTNIQLQ